MMVEVEYPKGTVFYCGLADTVKVKKGQEVKLGDVLGEVGNTSVVETAEDFHLHLSMKKDNKWIDPMTVMTKN
ncbi:MAG: M23 family metallopeptidase, partial [Oscillospiraceae bacterium]